MKFDLLKDHFKVAFRTLTRNKTYSLINVLGLTIGVVSCMLAYLITHHDLTFDNFHPDGDRVYRIIGERIWSTGDINPVNSFSSPLPNAIREEIHGVTEIAPIYPFGTSVSTPEGKRFEQGNKLNIVITGPEYFKVFHYDWIAGKAANLNKPNN